MTKVKKEKKNREIDKKQCFLCVLVLELARWVSHHLIWESLVFPIIQSGAEHRLVKDQLSFRATLILFVSLLCVPGASAGLP